MGVYYIIELEFNCQFILVKKQWDSVVLECIEQVCDLVWSVDVVVVVMQEGFVYICLVIFSMIFIWVKVEVNIFWKWKGNCFQYDWVLEWFYEQVVQVIQRYIYFDVVKCILVVSFGFVREQFCDYMF